jgi:hypothetical protein
MQEDNMAFFGIYRGIVMNTADPLMNGRVQVSVPSVNNIGSDWAMPCRKYKSNRMPPVGSAVWIMFEGGDPMHPVWMGCMA